MIVDCAVYEQGHRRKGEVSFIEAHAACRAGEGFVWLGLHEPTPDEFDSVRREFNLHELAVEDAMEAHQRPKLEVYEDSLFMVLRPAYYDDASETVEFGEIHLFVGEGFIVAVRHGRASALSVLRKQIEDRPDLLAHGPGAVLHAIVDRVVDDYLPVIDGLDNDIQEVEEEVFSPEAGSPVERIYKLKREVLTFERATMSLKEPLQRLATRPIDIVNPDVREYFRDVQDHLVHVTEMINGFDNLLTSVLDANLAQVGVRQNEDMRKISAWVAIAAVPTMIAGIYGMNFDSMPELRWRLGYPLILALMVAACWVLYSRFRKSGWL